MPNYATQADCLGYIEGLVIDNPAAFDRLIDRSERDIDHLLPGSNIRHMPAGVQAPVSAPIATVLSDAGNLFGAYVYRYTFVTVSGETNGSPPSNVVNAPAKQVQIDGILSGSPGSSDSRDAIVGRNVYRTPGGSPDMPGGEGLLVSFTDNTTHSFTDNISDNGLGSAISAQNTTTGRKVNVNSLNAVQEQALIRAVCAQVEYRLSQGEKFFRTPQFDSVSGPEFTTTGRMPWIGPKVRAELAETGLLRYGARARNGKRAERQSFFSGGWPLNPGRIWP